MCAATFAPDTAAAKKASKKQIAIQLYSVRDLIGSFGQNQHDYTDVLQALGKMGYTAVEAASYNDGKFYGKTPEAFKADVEAAGMEVLSSHTTRNLSEEELASGDFSQAMKWWDECIAAHKAAGMKYLVTPSMPMLKTLGELQRYCDYFNEIGKRCRENGILYGYHNHAFEFQKIEDRVMLEYMIEHTDPANVFFQMDVYWTVIGKASPVDLFHKYPGRFRMLHIKDLREIGQSGMVGFDAIFRNTDVAGVEQIVVEVEQYSYDVEKSVRMSLEYLLEAPFVKASYSK
ncbi:sugar phosphate isomerase/epimerase [Alistipes sp.]|nr:sugar phosphate isomerase/epimerase [Alistipes sp.]MCI7141089.1 sugar phosphate isomerase/epimerase [Alistipes sp.]MDY5395823.1 sugar phosphate isomerase/epimerase [Alistipes sp.]